MACYYVLKLTPLLTNRVSRRFDGIQGGLVLGYLIISVTDSTRSKVLSFPRTKNVVGLSI